MRKALWFVMLGLSVMGFGAGVAAEAADDVRPAVYAGRFYPADAQQLRDTIARLTLSARATQVALPRHRTLKALVMPHAGYVYSGLTAAHCVHVLSRHAFERVVLMGPDHRVGLRNAALSPASAWQTPLGRVPLDPAAGRLVRQFPDLFRSVPASDRSEHSLEVVLPFLQYHLKDFKLLPLVVGPCNIKRMATAVGGMLSEHTLLVVSSDLSHYLPYQAAREKDARTLAAILSRDADAFTAIDQPACGRFALQVLLSLAKQYDWQPVLLHYANSGDTAGDRDRVVGYAAIAFFGGPDMTSTAPQPPPDLSPRQGQILVHLARQTIGEELDQPAAPETAREMNDALTDEAFQHRRGTFVTLKIDGQLRGCIGNLAGDEPLAVSVRRNALNAAFHDFRFTPLTADELERVDIEISILTEPRPLDYDGPDDLLAKLRPKVDGVILGKRGRSATFLPQVWEQLPRPELFLGHLCQKAGLPVDAWRTEPLSIQTYQVTYFEEER